jgi:soluble lytic murein transglycosylase-like protein
VKRFGALALASLLAGSSVRADVGLPEVSTDFDAEFARAADLLEEGRREEGEKRLEAIRRKADQPAWDARVAFLLASDDGRAGNWAVAASRLENLPAASIGLEPYRELRLSEALEKDGRRDEALAAARRAFESEGPFAFRVEAGSTLARLLEEKRLYREAGEVLALASHAATTPAESAEISIDRVRLGLAAGDRAAVRQAAHDLLLESPTADAAKTTPSFARHAAREAELRLNAPDRGRRGRALVAAGDARRGVALLSRDRPSAWPEGERSENLLALARGQLALKRAKAAEETAARVPDDGTLASFQARIFRCDRIVARLRRGGPPPSADDPRLEPVILELETLTGPGVPAPVRAEARQRLLRMAAEADRFEDALRQAVELVREEPGTTHGFEPLWLLSWRRYLAGDYAGARARLEAIAPLYPEVSRQRRLTYWRARCLLVEGRRAEAEPLFASLASSDPLDLYGRFAKKHAPATGPAARAEIPDPSAATAAFARVDELLRLRMFEEASAEARTLLPSRGRDLRMAQADFALGRFLPAAAAIKRAIPEVGTAEEGRVPDGWRRLYYPIEEGDYLSSGADEFAIDVSLLRGLVRQESVFDATARSRAGAMGLTQLMPSTARTLARSVLRARYRRAFLYDPGVNARLGAAYLRRLMDRFGGSTLLALAAYNGGPSRIARVVRENPRLDEDELFETIPVYETRDYVRRVLLYAESYGELYP